MYAVFMKVYADDSHTATAREQLPKTRAPIAQQAGAKGGYWLAPQGGRGISVVVFESEDARKMTAQMKPGQPVGDIPGVTFKTVEVREVLASL